MGDGNASVKVASVKSELELDYSQFLEGIEIAKRVFDDFAEEIDRPLALHFDEDSNFDGLSEKISEIREDLENLGNLNLDNIDLNFNTDGVEEVRDAISEIREDIESINDANININMSADDVEETDYTVERLKAIIESINDKDINIKVNADGVISATANMEELKDSEEETEKESAGLGETLGTAIYAFQAVFQATKEVAEGSLEQFAQLQMAGHVASNVFGSFGSNVKSFASDSMTSLGMSSGATMHYADMLGFALKAQGATEQSAGEMSEQLVETADNMVLASGGTITMQQAVQTLTSAIAGQTYGLKSMGINVSGVNKKWSPLHQSMYIMHQVMQKVNKNFGSLSSNLNTTAGQMQISKSTMEQFGESIGEILAPQLAEVNKILSHLYDGFEHLSPMMKKGIVIAGEVGVGLLGLAATVAVVSTAVETLGKAFKDFDIDILTDPITIALAGIVVGVGLLYEAWKHNWDGMRKVIDTFARDVKNVIDDIVDGFKNLDNLGAPMKDITSIFNDFKGVVSSVGRAVIGFAESFLGAFHRDIFPTVSLFQNIGITILNVFSKVVKFVSGVIEIIATEFEKLSPTFERVGSFIASVISGIISALADMLDWINTNIIPIINPIIDFIEKSLKAILNIVVKVVNFVSKEFSKLGINGHKLGKDLTFIALGIGGIIALRKGVIGTLRGISKGFSSIMSIVGNVKGVFSALKNGIGEIITKLPELIQGFKDFDVVQAITDALAQADPITWIADAIVALIAVVVLLYEAWKHNWGGIRTTLEKVGGWIENKFKYLENVFEHWKTVAGNEVKKVTHFFERLPKDIETGLNDAKEKLLRWGKDIGDFFTKTIPHWMNEIKAWFAELPTKIEYGIGEAAAYIYIWGRDVWNFFTKTIPHWISSIGHWFSELPGRICRWLLQTLYKVTDWEARMLHKAEQTGRNFLNSIENWFEQLPGRICRWLVNAYNSTQNWKNNMINEAEQAGSNFLNSIINWFEQLPGHIETLLGNIINDIENWGSNMVNEGTRSMSNFCNSVVNAVENLPSEMEQIGTNIVDGLWNGLKSEWDGLMSWVHNAAHNIVAGFKHVLDIHSPSRRMYKEVGVWILPGISKAIEDGLPNLLNTITNQVDIMVNHMQKKIKDGVGNIKVPVPDAFSNLGSRISDNPIIWQQPNVNTNSGGYASSADRSSVNGGYSSSVNHHYEIHVHGANSDPQEIAKEIKRQLQLAQHGF